MDQAFLCQEELEGSMKRVVEIISVSYNDISDELIEPSLGRDCIIILTVWLIQTLVAAGWAGLFSGERG